MTELVTGSHKDAWAPVQGTNGGTAGAHGALPVCAVHLQTHRTPAVAYLDCQPRNHANLLAGWLPIRKRTYPLHVTYLSLLYGSCREPANHVPNYVRRLHAVVCQRRLNHQHVIGFREVSVSGLHSSL